MDLGRMRTIVRAAETLNYSQTARELFISQSAVTQQIASAEKELNIKLFERAGRGVQLTEAGAILAAGFQNLLSAYESIVAQAQRLNSASTELRLGYHGPMGGEILPFLLAAFREKMPDIRLSIRNGHYGVLVQDLDQGLLDLVFTEATELKAYPNLSAEYLFRDLPCVCMSTSNPLAKKTQLVPEDLKGQHLIVTNSLHPSASMSKLISGLKACGIDVDHAQIVNQLQTAFTMASANIGVTFIPRSFKNRAFQNLTFVDLEQDKYHMDMVLAYSRDRLTQAGSVFLQLCRDWDFPSWD